MELRVCAEDPTNNFLPSIGTLNRYRPPLPTTSGSAISMEDVRVDGGYEEGMEIPIYYDPMLAKLITWGKNRDEARQRLIEAIDNFEIEGVATTLQFGKFVLEHEAFISGKFDTHFIQHYFTPDKLQKEDEVEIAAQLALNLYLAHKNQLEISPVGVSDWFQKR
jgi:pyruvate carboxylase subunit A